MGDQDLLLASPANGRFDQQKVMVAKPQSTSGRVNPRERSERPAKRAWD
jgi:hypothetical protein